MKLVLEDVRQRFTAADGTVAEVLRGCTLATGEIRTLVLIGPSGGGKSTLLRILAGIDVPAAGRVSFDGRPLPRDEAGLLAWRRQVGTVFQAYNLFPHLSALDNLILPLVHVHGMTREAAEARIREPLARFGLAEHARKRPASLSGGQQQRIAILRALVVEPSILFLDEPTSALDPEMTSEVLDMIVEVGALGGQIVLATHEMGFARRVADELAFVADGLIEAHGPSTEFFDRPATPRLTGFLAKVL